MTLRSNDFWNSVSPSVHSSITQAIPANALELAISNYKGPSNSDSKCDFLVSMLRPYAEQDSQRESSTTALHALGLIRLQQRHYSAAETIWRSPVFSRDPAHPDLAVISNLATVLNEQGRYAEAEVEIRSVSELIASKLGPSSPQALGCQRILMVSLAGQDKMEGARRVGSQIEHVIKGLGGEEKESEMAALQADRLKLRQAQPST